VERSALEIIAHSDKFYYYDDKPIFDTIGQVPNWSSDPSMKERYPGAMKYHTKFFEQAQKCHNADNTDKMPEPSAPPMKYCSARGCELGKLAKAVQAAETLNTGDVEKIQRNLNTTAGKVPKDEKCRCNKGRVEDVNPLKNLTWWEECDAQEDENEMDGVKEDVIALQSKSTTMMQTLKDYDDSNQKMHLQMLVLAKQNEKLTKKIEEIMKTITPTAQISLEVTEVEVAEMAKEEEMKPCTVDAEASEEELDSNSSKKMWASDIKAANEAAAKKKKEQMEKYLENYNKFMKRVQKQFCGTTAKDKKKAMRSMKKIANKSLKAKAQDTSSDEFQDAELAGRRRLVPENDAKTTCKLTTPKGVEDYQSSEFKDAEQFDGKKQKVINLNCVSKPTQRQRVRLNKLRKVGKQYEELKKAKIMKMWLKAAKKVGEMKKRDTDASPKQSDGRRLVEVAYYGFIAVLLSLMCLLAAAVYMIYRQRDAKPHHLARIDSHRVQV